MESAGQALRRMLDNSIDVKTEVPRFTGLIYGNNGVGKTIFSIGLINQLIKDTPKNKIVLIDTSENWISLKNHPKIADNVKVIPYTNFHDVRVLAKAIHKGVGPLAEVGGVVIDQGSSAYQKTLDSGFLERVGGAPTLDKPTPEWADYNQSLFKYRTAIDDLTQVPGLHLITTAHVSENKNSKGEVINRYPNFSPAALNRVKEDLHLVAYLSARETRDPNNFDKNKYERFIQVHPTSLYDAKSKIPDLPIRMPIRDFIPAAVEWVMSGAPVAANPTYEELQEIEKEQQRVSAQQEVEENSGEEPPTSELDIEASNAEDELDFDSQPIIVD